MERFVVFLKMLAGLAAALWGGLPGLVQLLVFLMVFDVLSGFFAGYKAKQLSSDVSYAGMRKKAQVLIMVGFAGVLQHYVGIGRLAEGVAGFYCLHEGLSILENVGRAGVPIPAGLREALAKVPAVIASERAS